MTTKLAPFIKSLREKHRFSQVFVAERLHISRSSYMAVEKGTRELTLEEAKGLVQLFGITFEDLSRMVAPNYDKYKQMILAYLRAFTEPHDGKVPKTKLAKLLYLADFAWYYNTLESMSGAQYLRREFGPVPDDYFRAIEELELTGKINIERKGDATLVSLAEGARKPDESLLSPNELELIAAITEKWKDKKTSEIVEFTHQQLPYKLCAQDEVIPYELITQEDPGYVY
jgi:transcriptional regulator with XRE-family HTH domain